MGKQSIRSCFTSSVVLTGTAKGGVVGPPIGHVDLGISESTYLFRVAFPGVRKDQCELSCETEHDGKVHLQGVVTSGELAKSIPGSKKYQMGVVQLSPPGPFIVSFKLPGLVDPRLFSPMYRSDGILEGVVMKYNKPHSTSKRREQVTQEGDLLVGSVFGLCELTTCFWLLCFFEWHLLLAEWVGDRKNRRVGKEKRVQFPDA